MLTLFKSSPNSLAFAKTTSAKASLISHIETSSFDKLSVLSKFSIPTAGEVGHSTGFWAESMKPMILAFGVNPYFCKPIEFVRTQAAAPSANLDALALVTESPHGVAPQGGGT